jgi:hypothetical protein
MTLRREIIMNQFVGGDVDRVSHYRAVSLRGAQTLAAAIVFDAKKWGVDLEISQVCTWEIPVAYTQRSQGIVLLPLFNAAA